MMIRGLVEREGGAGTYALTDEGRAVLAALLERR
jgi:DNA-binding PadR family transcriptional regulator